MLLAIIAALSSYYDAGVLEARQSQRDGLFMVLGECETKSESVLPELASTVYYSCLNEHFGEE